MFTMKSSAEEGAHAPCGAGEAFAAEGQGAANAENHGGSVPEGGGTNPEVPMAPSRPAYIAAAVHAAAGEQSSVDAPPALYRNGKQLTVIKRDGREQLLKMFKLRSRVHRLMNGLNAAFVSEELVVEKVPPRPRAPCAPRAGAARDSSTPAAPLRLTTPRCRWWRGRTPGCARPNSTGCSPRPRRTSRQTTTTTRCSPRASPSRRSTRSPWPSSRRRSRG